MGVPMVTLLGDCHASRVGASLLRQVGLNDLIADTLDHYVEIAADLAGDTARLTELHAVLRDRMATSRLCNAPQFARTMEGAYRDIWRKWCRKSSTGQS